MGIMRFIPLLAGVTGAAVALLGAWGYVTLDNGFGARDLAPFAFWCLLFVAFVAALATLLARLARSPRRVLRMCLAFALGIPGGILYTVAVALVLGPMIAGFSFPVLFLWAAGAVAGLMVAAWPAPQPASSLAQRSSALRALAGVGAVLAAVIILPWLLLLGRIYIWDRAQSEVHLIPEGFRGPVVILFDQATGAAAEREGRARVYRVPPDGVLRTQWGPNHGWGTPDYYYVDAAGRRTSIVRGGQCTDTLSGDPLQTCYMAQMYLSGRSAPEYKSYIVAQRADRVAALARGDSLVRAVVYGEVVGSVP